MRDAFLRFAFSGVFQKHLVLVAEELNVFFPGGKYKDFLSFETDIAQISELIILFSESFGSAAELGAFVMVEEISSRLLVVIDDKNYEDSSFIKLGPIKMLEDIYGSTSSCVIDRKDISIENIWDLSTLDEPAFKRIISQAFTRRSATKVREHSTFNKNRNGHVIKLIIGLLQHYGALTLDEIDLYLSCFDVVVSQDDIVNYLKCAEFAEWIIETKNIFDTYYSCCAEKSALQYNLLADSPIRDKVRWKADIYDYWKSTDQARFSSIRKAAEKMAE